MMRIADMRYESPLFICLNVLLAAVHIGNHPAYSLSDDAKIVGGSLVTDIRTRPYVISLQLKIPSSGLWLSFCGGSIFSPLYVVTACHCVTHLNKSGHLIPLVNLVPLTNFRLVAGTVHLLHLDESHQFRSPSSIRYHPQCDREEQVQLAYDLALIKTAQPFAFNDRVKSVRIFSLNRENYEEQLDKMFKKQPTKCVVSGWGTTERQSIASAFHQFHTNSTESGSTNSKPTASGRNSGEEATASGIHEEENQLKTISLEPMYEGECLFKLMLVLASVFGGFNLQAAESYGRLLHHQICAVSENGQDSVCRGDSGSGLVCGGFIVGVVSWGVGCGTPAPDVFQGLSSTMHWFEKEVCAVESCNDTQNLPQQCSNPELDSFLKKCNGSEQSRVSEKTERETARNISEGTQPKNQEMNPSSSSICCKFTLQKLIPLLISIKRI